MVVARAAEFEPLLVIVVDGYQGGANPLCAKRRSKKTLRRVVALLSLI